MKKFLTLLLSIGILFGLTGCGVKLPEGKYESGKSIDDTYGYYTCNENNECDWYFYIASFGKSKAKYTYTYDSNKDGTYTLHMKEVDGDTEYDVIYYPETETIVDEEINVTYKKN